MTEHQTAQLWDEEAATFDEEADHGLRDPVVRAAWRRLLVDLLPPAPARVADLGCGTGTLAVLLTEEGYAVDGVDFSPAMIRAARAKAADHKGLSFRVGDAAEPDLEPGGYDAVLCRHVLWALPDPATALRRWEALLSPEGRLVLIEGSWSTGAGLTAEQTVGLVESIGRRARLTVLAEAAYWGREITDERYAVLGR